MTQPSCPPNGGLLVTLIAEGIPGMTPSPPDLSKGGRRSARGPARRPTEESTRTSLTAILALAVSIIGWLVLFGPSGEITAIIAGALAVVLGLVARNQIRESAVPTKGKGLATTGIVLGALQILLVAVSAFQVSPV